jgi:hypothetical protein
MDSLWRNYRGARPTCQSAISGIRAYEGEEQDWLPRTAADALSSGWAKLANKKDEQKNKKQSTNFCSLCRVNFPTHEAILAHICEQHPPRRYGEEKPEPELVRRFTCVVCGQLFVSYAEQCRHVSDCHVDRTVEQEEEEEMYEWQEAGRRRGMCGSCGLDTHEGIPCLTSLYFCTDCPSARLYT